MTIEEAVQVLNRFKHLGCEQWHVSVSPAEHGDGAIRGCDQYDLRYGSEAIAIAEWYLRHFAQG